MMTIPKTQADAEQHLRRLCEIQIKRDAIQVEMNRRVTAARAAAESLDAPLEKEKRALETAVKAWFRVERKSLGEQKSVKLLFGTVKATARKAVGFFGRWDDGSAAEALLTMGAWARKFVRQKISLNKEAVHDASPEDLELLSSVGVRVSTAETVAIVLDLDALKDRTEARK